MKYEFTYRVNLDDLDYMGIVGHAQWLLILQRARIDLLEALGLSYEFLAESGAAAVVRSVSIEFLAPAKHRDLIRVGIEAVELTATSLLLRYVVSSAERKRFVACDLRLVFVAASGRPMRIPERLKTALEQATLNPKPTEDRR